MSQEEITVDTGYAANLSRSDSENYLTVSGIAIGEDEVTSHAKGDKFWPAEQLMAATQSLIGVQLTKNHNHDKVEGIIGEVTDARYKEGVGILFEAKVYEESVASKIREGLLEVSVHAIHSNGGWNEDGEMIVENVEFRDLSVVPRGAAASNMVKVGSMEPATLSAESIEDMIGGEFDSQLADIEDLTQGTLVMWEEGAAHGEVVDTITSGVYDGAIDGDVVVEAPAALIEVWNVMDGEWQASGTMVAHKPETLTIIDELPDPESEMSELSEHSEEFEQVWEDFNDIVNMTAGQLRSWSENPCSREASQDPKAVIKRNLRLLSRNKDEWTEGDVDDAKRTISFISRMREQQPSEPMSGPVEGCPSKWAISLLNWAYNPFESIPSIPDEMDSVDEITLDSHDEMKETEAAAVHTVEYNGTEENDWEAPNLEDFPDEYFDSDGNAKFDLVDDHFLYSESQFPPEKYTELKFPVVSPDGMLNLAALRAAKSRAPQADIPESDIEEIQSTVNELAQSEFDKDWADTSTEESDDGDSAESQSSLADTSQESDTMTEEDTTEDIDVEALQERVSALEEQNASLESEVQSVRMEYAEALSGDSAFSAEELAEKFTVEELATKYDESDIQIAEASAPAPQTGAVEEEEVEASEKEEYSEEIAMLERQIQTYDDMGWESALAEAEAELSEYRNEDAE